MRFTVRIGAVVGAIAVIALTATPAFAGQSPSQPGPKLDWQTCGDAPGVQCTTAKLPRDYSNPGAGNVKLFLAKSPATDPSKRLGSLFFNFGGPGAPAADYVESYGADLLPALNERYDLIGMDPRGVGQSTPSIDCKTNQEKNGIYSQPFTTPENLNVKALVAKDAAYVARCVALNHDILPYVSTANVARDMNVLKSAVGDQKLSYIGFSYGTYLGATFASMFPNDYRAMVLDGPVDATAYANHPMNDLAEQSSAFERALGRFFQACASDQVACAGFGGSDPWSAFDQLVEKANQAPIPATGYDTDPRPVDGDDILMAASEDVYAKQYWPELAGYLAAAANDNDASGLRLLTDLAYGRNDDGTFAPDSDRYFTIGAIDQRYPHDLQTYLDAGDHSWGQHDHFWWNNGYIELNYGLFPVQPRGVFYGPFKIPSSSPTPLVVATTYDPATPYKGAKRLVRDLGNARLLTMRGDGHTAYTLGSPDCIDPAVEGYLNTGVLPAPGTVCQQDVPFEQPQPEPQAKTLLAPAAPGADIPRRPHTRPLGI